MLDLSAIRRQFPALQQLIDGHPLTYLDNAATTQKPTAVLEAMGQFYETSNANPHRGMHVLAERATEAYEHARSTVQQFLHAQHPEEIIFTKNCTEAINIVARSFGSTLHSGDAVVTTMLEHHSNIVPWLQLKEERGIDVRWIDIDDEGHLRIDQLDAILADGNVKLVTVTAQSNVLGTRPDLPAIIRKAHDAGALVLVDAAQGIAHHPIDVQSLDCDFLAFSGHKLYGPIGIGVLYGKRDLLRAMPPFLGGGMMIHEVTKDHFSPADLPQKFEAGTQPVAEAVGLTAAIDWLGRFLWKDIKAHEHSLLALAHKELSAINGLRILGSPDPSDQSGCISFTLENIHPHDLTEILGRKGICLRAGHHCTQPLHKRLGINASTRLSIGIYNTEEEIMRVRPTVEEAIAKLEKE